MEKDKPRVNQVVIELLSRQKKMKRKMDDNSEYRRNFSSTQNKIEKKPHQNARLCKYFIFVRLFSFSEITR